MINQTTFSTLNQAIAGAQELLTTFAFSDELLGDLTTAFGDEYNREAALDLVSQWQSGEFGSFPEIEILSSDTINGANGAYSVDTNKIYITKEYLLANADNINAVSDLILEEYGHYVDAQINPEDGAGDEGALFSGLVQGESFTDEQLQLLKAENDRAVVTIDGEEIAIEQQITYHTSSSDNNDFRGTRGNDTYYFDADSQLGSDLISENTIALRTHHGTYIRADEPGSGWAVNQQSSIGSWETFDVITRSNGKVGFKTAHGRYLQATNDWGVRQQSYIGDWEQFDVITDSDSRVANGKVALKTHFNTYLKATNESAMSQQTFIENFEQFDVISQNYDTDTLDFSATTTQNITIDLSRYTPQRVNSNLTLKLDSALGIDIEKVVGGQLNDTITGNHLNNTIYAKEGDDYVDGGNGDDRITGLGGDDTLNGGDGSDALNGGNGNDSLNGGAVNGDDGAIDSLYGGAGDDTLNSGWGKDVLDGGSGIDTVDFSQAPNGYLIDLPNQDANGKSLISIENIIGSIHNDEIIGDDASNTLEGKNGDDTLNGGAGNDTLNGGDGIDTVDYSSDTAGVTVDLSAGTATDGSGSTDTLSNIENVVGSNFADTLKGDGNANRLEGGGGDDLLKGYNGNDILSGGAGDDTLDGESGSDRFFSTIAIAFSMRLCLKSISDRDH